MVAYNSHIYVSSIRKLEKTAARNKSSQDLDHALDFIVGTKVKVDNLHLRSGVLVQML